MNSLEDAIKKEKAEYHRKWRAANKDKVSKNNQNYWKRRAEQKIIEQSKEVG